MTFCSAYSSQLHLSGMRRPLPYSPSEGDSKLLTTSTVQRVVHTAKVFTAHKWRSKLIHSSNTSRKLWQTVLCVDTVVSCWIKKVTHFLSFPAHTHKSCSRENMKCVWDCKCHPGGEQLLFWTSQLHAWEACGPHFWGEEGQSLSPASVSQVRAAVLPAGMLPLGEAVC
jgi:hypothetical protein